uniref:Elongation of very long chain fatty acids protein n=1 Tax=Astyanax mexicanus TaxID=7994 RepID=A0A3B1K7R9_ASTMX
MNQTLLQVFDFEQKFDEKGAFQWFQENWTASYVFCAAYAAVIFLGRFFMRRREKWDLRRPLMFWSLSLALFSICGSIRTGSYMLNTYSSHGFRQTVCDTNFYSAPFSKFWAYAFTLSKVPELGDTVFIVLRKQRLIFLHWYHHITVLLYTWASYKDHVAGGGWFMTMNYSVHALMYSYYTAKAAGIQLPKPCAILITSMQILQMAMGLTVLALVYFWHHEVHCASNMQNIMWGSLMYLSYLLLFSWFFYQTYLKKDKRKGAKAE